MTADLRHGHYSVLDVEVDHALPDPPFGKRTHEGQRHGRSKCEGKHLLSTRGLEYECWSPEDVRAYVAFRAPRCRGWFVPMTSHDLIESYTLAMEKEGRYVFAPVPVVLAHANVRLAGDGPSNWTFYLVPSRPKKAPYSKWGALPGAYYGQPFDIGENMLDRSKRPRAGGKPLWVCRAIVRDYSRVGDLIADDTAGGGTMLLAALQEGRRAVGSEIHLGTYEKARAKLAMGYTPPLFVSEPRRTVQTALFDVEAPR